MNEQVLRQALRDSVEEVLEKMFFAQTMGECPAAGETAPPASEMAVALTFQGEPSGSLLLRLTSAAARQIAADFLGIEEADVSETQTSEVLREMANMICGSVLSRVESAAIFHLGVPQIVPASEEFIGNSFHTRYGVQLANGRLIVNVGTGTQICPQPVPSAY